MATLLSPTTNKVISSQGIHGISNQSLTETEAKASVMTPPLTTTTHHPSTANGRPPTANRPPPTANHHPGTPISLSGSGPLVRRAACAAAAVPGLAGGPPTGVEAGAAGGAGAVGGPGRPSGRRAATAVGVGGAAVLPELLSR